MKELKIISRITLLLLMGLIFILANCSKFRDIGIETQSELDFKDDLSIDIQSHKNRQTVAMNIRVYGTYKVSRTYTNTIEYIRVYYTLSNSDTTNYVAVETNNSTNYSARISFTIRGDYYVWAEIRNHRKKFYRSEPILLSVGNVPDVLIKSPVSYGKMYKTAIKNISLSGTASISEEFKIDRVMVTISNRALQYPLTYKAEGTTNWTFTITESMLIVEEYLIVEGTNYIFAKSVSDKGKESEEEWIMVFYDPGVLKIKIITPTNNQKVATNFSIYGQIETVAPLKNDRVHIWIATTNSPETVIYRTNVIFDTGLSNFRCDIKGVINNLDSYNVYVSATNITGAATGSAVAKSRITMAIMPEIFITNFNGVTVVNNLISSNNIKTGHVIKGYAVAPANSAYAPDKIRIDVISYFRYYVDVVNEENKVIKALMMRPTTNSLEITGNPNDTTKVNEWSWNVDANWLSEGKNEIYVKANVQGSEEWSQEKVFNLYIDTVYPSNVMVYPERGYLLPTLYLPIKGYYFEENVDWIRYQYWTNNQPTTNEYVVLGYYEYTNVRMYTNEIGPLKEDTVYYYRAIISDKMGHRYTNNAMSNKTPVLPRIFFVSHTNGQIDANGYLIIQGISSGDFGVKECWIQTNANTPYIKVTPATYWQINVGTLGMYEGNYTIRAYSKSYEDVIGPTNTLTIFRKYDPYGTDMDTLTPANTNNKTIGYWYGETRVIIQYNNGRWFSPYIYLTNNDINNPNIIHWSDGPTNYNFSFYKVIYNSHDPGYFQIPVAFNRNAFSSPTNLLPDMCDFYQDIHFYGKEIQFYYISSSCDWTDQWQTWSYWGNDELGFIPDNNLERDGSGGSPMYQSIWYPVIYKSKGNTNGYYKLTIAKYKRRWNHNWSARPIGNYIMIDNIRVLGQ